MCDSPKRMVEWCGIFGTAETMNATACIVDAFEVPTLSVMKHYFFFHITGDTLEDERIGQAISSFHLPTCPSLPRLPLSH